MVYLFGLHTTDLKLKVSDFIKKEKNTASTIKKHTSNSLFHFFKDIWIRIAYKTPGSCRNILLG